MLVSYISDILKIKNRPRTCIISLISIVTMHVNSVLIIITSYMLQKIDLEREVPRVRPVTAGYGGFPHERESAGSGLYTLYTPDQSTLGMQSHAATSATPSAADHELQVQYTDSLVY